VNQPLQQIPAPDLRALLNLHKREVFSSLNCHQVGEIVSFNSALQTATVKIATNKQVVDYTKQPPAFVYLPYPLLTDCPVHFASGGSGRLTFPVTAGDPCVILFNDRDIDNWFEGGANTPPNSARAHDLSDGLVLVGFRNKVNALASFYASGAELAFAGGRLRINDKVALDGALSSLKAVLNAVTTALTALDAKTGPSAAAAIALAQIEIDNLMQ
jgi:hypothetical protein